MPDRQHAENLFLEHRRWIERTARMVCRQHGVPDAEADDFVAWVWTKLIEDDYAVLRRFRGDSQLTTYLANVVTRQFVEYQRQRGGRWRASAAAERRGPPAPELEALVYRDGYRLEQAGEKLRTEGQTAMSDADLARLLAELPPRGPLRPREVSSDPALDAVPGSLHADEHVSAAETDALRGRLYDALRRVMDQLDPEDRMIVRMHLADGRTLADVARALRLEQKPLYRRVEKLRQRLRGLLEAGGIGQADVRELLDHGKAP